MRHLSRTAPGIAFLFALGFQVSGAQNIALAILMWTIGGVWTIGAVASDPETQRRFPKLRRIPILVGADSEAVLRIELKDMLGAADQEAMSLEKRDPPPNETEVDAWVNKTIQLIGGAVGPGEASLFASSAGLTYHSIRLGMPQEVSTNLAHRRQRLADLIARIDAISVRRDFDTQEWR